MAQMIKPTSLKDALTKLNREEYIIYAGGSDLILAHLKNEEISLDGFNNNILYIGSLA